MADCGEMYSEVFIAHDDGNCDIANNILHAMEDQGFTCSIGGRDFVPGIPLIDNIRSAVKNSQVVITYVTRAYSKSHMGYYEPALALDMHKDVILINAEEIKIPPLFRSCKIIPSGRRTFDIWIKDLSKITTRLLDNEISKTVPIQWSLLKEFIWSVEEFMQSTTQSTISESTRQYLTEIENLKKERNVLLQVRMREISELQKDNEELQAKIDSLQRKQEEFENERKVLLSEVHKYQTSREHVWEQSEKLAKRQIEYHIEIRKIKLQLDNINQLLLNDRGGNLLREIADNVENLTRSQNSTSNSIEILSNAVYGIIRNANSNRDMDDSENTKIPSDIRTFCNRYQNMVGHNILKLARYLGLSEDQIIQVEKRREYGHCEMFWSAIRQWVSSSCEDSVTFRKLLDSLEEAGIQVEGHPMPKEHLQRFQRNMVFLQENVLCITLILSDLLEQGVVDIVGISYVLTSDTRDLQILRLVDVLSITDRGLPAFCVAMKNSGQCFISDHLTAGMENRHLCPNEPCGHDENSRYSILDENINGKDKRREKIDSKIERETDLNDIPVAKVLPTRNVELTADTQKQQTMEYDLKPENIKQKRGRIQRFFSFFKINT